MAVVARAPGKLVLLGEYAVLAGAPALVMAVDYRCHARIGRGKGEFCRLTTRFPAEETHAFVAGEPTGVPLVDAYTAAAGTRPRWPVFDASLDSTALYAGGTKLGLGSSAAALVAWAGAWGGAAVGGPVRPTLEPLVAVHRAFQGGAGSGLDVAAALTGGVIRFTLDAAGMPRIVSVRLPNSVGFAGIFAGSSASTPGLVAHYHRWVDEKPREAGRLLGRLRDLAERGCAAGSGNDGAAFVAAMAEYGRGLGELGAAMGADLVTREHAAAEDLARRFGVAYKVSGAGGGDLGLAVSSDPEALAAFSAAAAESGFQVVALAIDELGLVVEELAE